MKFEKPYPFDLDVEKAVQAVAVILREEPNHCMNYMKLLKVLYLAEREMLTQSGSMITGDHAVAMERGPVLSGVYNLIKGEHTDAEKWDAFIDKERYHVSLKQHPGNEKLSKLEIEILRETTAKYQQFDEWDMVAETHKLPEWKQNAPEPKTTNEPKKPAQKPIPFMHILQSIGMNGQASKIVEQAETDAAFDAFFAKNRTCGEPTRSTSMPLD